MKARLLSLAACAAATALLLPALQSGAAAQAPDKDRKPGGAPGAAACAVTVDPTTSVGAAGGAVLQDATLENDPSKNPATLGYFVERTEYEGSSAFRATINYTPPATGGCGSISLLTFPYVTGADGAATFLPEVQSRTVQLSGAATSVAIDSLVVGLPGNSVKNDAGLCVGSQIQVRDAAGAVVAKFPQTGALDFCPIPGGRTYV